MIKLMEMTKNTLAKLDPINGRAMIAEMRQKIGLGTRHASI